MNREEMKGFAVESSRTSKVVITSVLASSAVTAQERGKQPSGLEEIVVTATRREQSLQDVPLSVSAISAENLIARGVNSLSDLNPGAMPGLIVSQFAGTPSVLAISVRGVGLSDSTQGTTEMPVPVYLDGVFLGRGQGLGTRIDRA